MYERGKTPRCWCVFHGWMTGGECPRCDEMWAEAARVADEVAAEVLRERGQAPRQVDRRARRKRA